MSRRLATLALCAAAALGATPAHADWSFTNWGMSPDQVIKASRGRVSAEAGKPGDRVLKFDLRAAGIVSFKGRKYVAQFYFDEDGGTGLRFVRMSPVDQSQCDALKADLVKSYGPASARTWTDWKQPNGDTIGYSDPYKSLNFPCYFSYSKR